MSGRVSAEHLQAALLEILELLSDELDKKGDIVRKGLAPAAMNSRIKELRRGGLPTSSMGNGSRGAETPIPVRELVIRRAEDGTPTAWRTVTADSLDEALRRAGIMYARGISQAVSGLRAASNAQKFVLSVVADVEKELAPAPCENPACGLELEQNRRTGECVRCRVWKHRHGIEYPKIQEVAPASPSTTGGMVDTA